MLLIFIVSMFASDPVMSDISNDLWHESKGFEQNLIRPPINIS